MKLYELANDFLEVENLEGVDAATQIEIINAIKTEISNKGDGIIKFIRNEEASLKVIDEEIKRLQALKKSKNTKIRNMKSYLMHCMRLMGMKKIEGNLGRISIRKNPASLEILDGTIIPQEYMIKEVIINLDKTRVKEMLKNGETVPGCALVQGESITIK